MTTLPLHMVYLGTRRLSDAGRTLHVQSLLYGRLRFTNNDVLRYINRFHVERWSVLDRWLTYMTETQHRRLDITYITMMIQCLLLRYSLHILTNLRACVCAFKRTFPSM